MRWGLVPRGREGENERSLGERELREVRKVGLRKNGGFGQRWKKRGKNWF